MQQDDAIYTARTGRCTNPCWRGILEGGILAIQNVRILADKPTWPSGFKALLQQLPVQAFRYTIYADSLLRGLRDPFTDVYILQHSIASMFRALAMTAINHILRMLCSESTYLKESRRNL